MGRLVGIDFGKARIGIAITDERRIITKPLSTIRTAKDPISTAKLVGEALAPCGKIDAIVIGLPLQLNGKEGEMALAVRAFGTILEQTLSYPIVYWDERLTSAQVEKMLIAADVNRKKRAEVSDGLAAAAILQSYLDSLGNK